MCTRVETEQQELLNDIQWLRYMCRPRTLSSELSFTASPLGVGNG